MYVHECTYVGFELMLCFEYVCTVAYIGTSYVRAESQVKTSLFLAEVAGIKRPSSSVQPNASFVLPPFSYQILSQENWPTFLRLFEFR